MVAFAPYGARHREGRKLITGALSPHKTPELHAVQEAKTSVLISRLTEAPAEFWTHIRWYVKSILSMMPISLQIERLVASIVLEVSYGITVNSYDDPFVREIETALADISDLLAPGAYLVDAIPSRE